MQSGIHVIDLIRAGRFPFALAAGGLALVVVLGIALSVLQMRVGLSSRAVGLVAIPVFLGTIGAMAWFALGSQGTVTVGEGELVVDPRGQRAFRIALPPQHVSLLVYTPRDRALIARTYGPMVRIEGTEQEIHLAAALPEILDVYPPADTWPRNVNPPDYFISPDDLNRLLVGLGQDPVPVGRPGR